MQGAFFVVPAGGGANGDDPIASPGLEGVFIDSGGLFLILFFFQNFLLALSLVEFVLCKSACFFFSKFSLDFDTVAVVGSIAARTPFFSPLAPFLSLGALALLAWRFVRHSRVDAVYPVICDTSVQELRLPPPP